MNQTHSGEKRRMNRKRLAMLLSLILVITCTVGGTLAYLFTRTESITNTFVPARVNCVVAETPENQFTVTNDSETSVWLRVSITAVYRNAVDTTVIHWENPEIIVSEDTSWQLEDGFYYYKAEVAAGGTASLPVITFDNAPPSGFVLEKQILAEVIQSAPLIAVQEAWSMTRVDDQWQVYTSTPIV